MSGSAPWESVLRGNKNESAAEQPSAEQGESEGNISSAGRDDQDEQDGPTITKPDDPTGEGGPAEQGGSEGEVSSTGREDRNEEDEPIITKPEEPTIVDSDKAPRTPQEIETYLTVDGVRITEADIHLAANEIAVLNGFKDLDYRVFTGADPDWIYPGNHLEMPSGEDYVIRKGDTIWFLAARQVRLGVDEDKRAFDKALSVLDDTSSTEDEKREARSVLKKIAEESKAQAMRRMAAEKLL